ncbi:MAG: hypothetical protein GXP54_03140 [Deltaproteobacteria bacterium]|nr:hypothetical protein [Deltaproteobacteria bacterium]
MLRTISLFSMVTLSSIAVITAGCSSGTVPDKPKIDVEGQVKAGGSGWEHIDTGQDVTIGAVFNPGDEWGYQVCIENPGTVDLRIDALSLEFSPCAGDTGDVPLFQVVYKETPAFPVSVSPADMPGGAITRFCAEIRFTRGQGQCEHSATLHISNNSVISDFIINFGEKAQDAPNFMASPEVLDLGIVKEGTKSEGVLNLLNTGLGDLVISEVRYRSPVEGFSFQWGCDGSDGKPIEDYYFPGSEFNTIGAETCDSPVVVPANSSFQVPVSYGASSDEPAKAFLTFLSNDPVTGADGLDVEVWANVSGPCLKAEPEEVDFGTVVTTTLEIQPVALVSCGDKEVEITGVALSKDSSPDFELDLEGLGDFSKDKPLVLQPGEKKSFVVKYLPLSVDKDVDEKVVPDTGTILVDNSSVYTPREIPINGIGVAGECPVADFMIMSDGKEVPDGGDVLVQSTLEFYDQSYDPTTGGGIIGWEWTNSAPNGSADIFEPSSTFKQPFFTANMAGDYLFRLKVFNKLGFESCNTAEKLVHVKAGEGCHVELTWSTPNDPDPTDQCSAGKDCGSDMDLHVVHPYASSADVDHDGKPDGFFDLKYDCFWFNPHPIWVEDSALDPLFQPHLDRDDTDGAGPENFNYVSPEPGKCYKVGAHYWDDHGFGASYPTIKMFIDGDLVYEKTAPKMKNMDMWEAGEACCSDKANPFIEYEIGGAPVIIKNYVNPDFNFTPQ